MKNVASQEEESAGVRSRFSRLFVWLHRRVRSDRMRAWLRRWLVRLEGGPDRTLTVREVLWNDYGIQVGLYTAGPCRTNPKYLHSGTFIGRYSYVAESVRTFTRNHPMDTKSSHGVFYNPLLGAVKAAPVQFKGLEIGHGVWIGHNAIILPPTREIGHGAVIAPGAVVYSDVPPYSLVSGSPAVITGRRYNPDTVQQLVDSRWWESSPDELEQLDVYRQLVDSDQPGAD